MTVSFPALDKKIGPNAWLHRHVCARCGYSNGNVHAISNDTMRRIRSGETQELCQDCSLKEAGLLPNAKAVCPRCHTSHINPMQIEAIMDWGCCLNCEHLDAEALLDQGDEESEN